MGAHPVNIDGLHLLLTYQCNYECEHCFVWGGPHQYGTMTLENITEILRQAQDVGTVKWIYFEGGEPFLYYAALQRGVEMAASAGFRVGIVSNAYWATGMEDALACLSPFAGRVQDLSISSDAYHWSDADDRQSRIAQGAASRSTSSASPRRKPPILRPAVARSRLASRPWCSAAARHSGLRRGRIPTGGGNSRSALSRTCGNPAGCTWMRMGTSTFARD